MSKKLPIAVKIILLCIASLLLGYFLWFRFHLGLVRYMDVDEFAHLRWANFLLQGKRPYIDFLLFFPLGFHWFLAPLFWLGSGTVPILAGRVAMFAVFAGMCTASALLFWYMREKPFLAVTAALLLAFLPMPLDKYIEIRPDNLATLLLLVGMFVQVVSMRTKRVVLGFIAGILYGISVIVLTKTVPYVGIAAVIACCWSFSLSEGMKQKVQRTRIYFVPFFVGLVVPLMVFGIWLLTLGHFDIVYYSLTKLPLEANRISQYFIMMPDLFFYPNSIFYGQNGWPQGLVVNHVLYVLGIVVAVYRLFTAYLTGGKDRAWEEILVSSIFLAHVIAFIEFIPLKHTQYLIPVGVFVAWYSADAVYMLWQKMVRFPVGQGIFLLGYAAGAVFLYQTFQLVNGPKLSWTNTETLTGLTKLYATIPKSEYVLDMDGRTLYYPSPYIACCIPFGQFARFLSRPLPSIADALEKTHTKYIFQGQLQRTNTLPPVDQEYIRTHYTPLNGDIQLLVRFN